jgi:hypothetical protein
MIRSDCPPHTAHKGTQQHVVEIEMQRMVICHDLGRRLTEILEGAGAGGVAGGTGLLGMHGDAGMCHAPMMQLHCFFAVLSSNPCGVAESRSRLDHTAVVRILCRRSHAFMTRINTRLQHT